MTTTQLACDLHAAAAAWIETIRGGDGALHAAASQPVIDAAIAALHAAVSINPEDPYHLEQLAMLHHNRGRLDLARDLYAIVNRLDQPATPEERQAAAIARNCPIALTTSAECFALRDAAALHHPDEPLIAYHVFWEDDWNYPDDDEPCDHEVIWVRYHPSDLTPAAVSTYFHGRILTGRVPDTDGRPAVAFQWGTHGPLPTGWDALDGVAAALRRDFDAARRGGRAAEHPRKQGWPPRFPGAWGDYTRFERRIDPLPVLHRNRWIMRGRWANAVLYHYLVPYNFHAKREWPDDGLVNL